MDSGMVLRSALPLTPEAEDSLTHRSPSTITSVRLESRLRRSTWEEPAPMPPPSGGYPKRSEEHTSELQSQSNLVCRLLLEKKKKKTYTHTARLHQHRVQRHINVILGGGVIHCDALSPRHIDTVI